ncbi:MAG TPA: hypothetical protein DD723_01320 [Candidatus Omnitrophica bacterium]|nr:MAG: hypothetical protein A2Z81_02105 [Omnitrophica WOR_2 bacterium GWA2_45_18]OGX19938.1 MAG: hypothetical protein A2Y04_04150 [Omnitrophica WOR_2 bacterium GWC2_45_7]HBR14171.1 hypothetical protein [Candidatus Omnitrophota bacterium]
MIGKKEKCFSPWLGFLVIVVVCVVMAGAIFIEFKGTRKHGKAHRKATPKKAAVQAAFPNPSTDVDAANKFVF